MRIESSVQLQIFERLVFMDFSDLEGAGALLPRLSRMEVDRAYSTLGLFPPQTFTSKISLV